MQQMPDLDPGPVGALSATRANGRRRSSDQCLRPAEAGGHPSPPPNIIAGEGDKPKCYYSHGNCWPHGFSNPLGQPQRRTPRKRRTSGISRGARMSLARNSVSKASGRVKARQEEPARHPSLSGCYLLCKKQRSRLKMPAWGLKKERGSF